MLDSPTWTPNRLAAARILPIAFSPNGDWVASASALRTWAASCTGKCLRLRGVVFPSESFVPPLSMYAKALSGRSLIDSVDMAAIEMRLPVHGGGGRLVE